MQMRVITHVIGSGYVESCRKYEGGMSHSKRVCYSNTCDSPVTGLVPRIDELCHTCECGAHHTYRVTVTHIHGRRFQLGLFTTAYCLFVDD